MHDARQARRARRHRAARGNRAGTGPARAPGPTDAPHVAARIRHPPNAHIAPTARSKQREQTFKYLDEHI